MLLTQRFVDALAFAMEAHGDQTRKGGAIPCGLLAGGTVTAAIRKGELITYANAKPADGSKIAALRAKQDELVYGLERV